MSYPRTHNHLNELAEMAYVAYWAGSTGKGEIYNEWDAISEQERDAWREATNSVVLEMRRRQQER